MGDVWQDAGDVRGVMLAIANAINQFYGVETVPREVLDNERELAAAVQENVVEQRQANAEAEYDAVEKQVNDEESQAVVNNPVQDRADEIFAEMTAAVMQESYEKLGGKDRLTGPKADKARQLAEYEALIGRAGTDEDTLGLESMGTGELFKLDIVTLRGDLRDKGVDFSFDADKEELIKLIKNPPAEDDEDEAYTWDEILEMDKEKLLTMDFGFEIEGKSDMTRRQLLKAIEDGLFE